MRDQCGVFGSALLPDGLFGLFGFAVLGLVLLGLVPLGFIVLGLVPLGLFGLAVSVPVGLPTVFVLPLVVVLPVSVVPGGAATVLPVEPAVVPVLSGPEVAPVLGCPL